jgi:pyruvate ferredoxin oxidoreductase gamma subunit
MYRFRLHGRGGQGIKTAGQVLGTAFALEGFEVQDAPRYGAERRGAPIVSYVRAGRAQIHERGVITRPDLVVLADETLMPVPAAAVLQGLSAHALLLIASDEPADAWRERLKLEGPVLVLPVPAAATGAGLVCAAAAARLTGAIRRASLEQAVREELGGALERSVALALAAFDAMAAHEGVVREGVELSAAACEPPDWIELPFERAATSAPDIVAPATSELVKTGAWRTMKPVIDYARCNRCSWVCSTLCPDSAIAVDADRTPRIDYDHCKGCMICVAVCPPHAIHAVPEKRTEP